MINAPIIDIELQLRGPVAAKLEAAAKVRGRPPGDLLADVIEVVIEDDLFEAVLDDAEPRSPTR